MSLQFGYKALTVAVVSGLAATTAQAAGLDRSGQDITAFLQNGTYAEAVYTYIDADVKGKDTAGNAVPDMANSYDFFRYGVKTDINDTFSVGVLYDEPFGASVQYKGVNNFVSQGGDNTITSLTNGRMPDLATAQNSLLRLNAGFQGLANINQMLQDADPAFAGFLQAQKDEIEQRILTATGTNNLQEAQAAATRLGAAINASKTAEIQKDEGTSVDIRTNNITMLVGAKFGANKNFQVYGGPAAQRLNGEVKLRGTAYNAITGYDARIATDTAVGWVAGAAFYKPEIALKAALTYRSEIEHNSTIAEAVPALATSTNRDFSVTLPSSWNLDFQTGVNPTTLLTAKVRYVPWGDFDIRPPSYGAATQRATGTALPIVSYAKDQWSAELGLGKKLSDRLAVSGSVGYDSGAGNPATSLGPIKGYYSVGLGAKYNITPEWSLSAGGKYLKFGDAEAQLPTKATVGKFEDNDGYIVGVKLAYQSK